MSLNYDSTKCDPPIPINDEDSQVRECLVWGTMNTGISEITATNWTEVYARMSLIEKVTGPYRRQVPSVKVVEPGETGVDSTQLKSDDEDDLIPVYITPAEVKRWIGLCTNASPKTRIQFLRYFVYDLNDAVKYAEVCNEKVEEEIKKCLNTW